MLVPLLLVELRGAVHDDGVAVDVEPRSSRGSTAAWRSRTAPRAVGLLGRNGGGSTKATAAAGSRSALESFIDLRAGEFGMSWCRRRRRRRGDGWPLCFFVCLLSLRSSSAAAGAGRGGRSRAGRTALARRRRKGFWCFSRRVPRLRVSPARDCHLNGRSCSGAVGGDSEADFLACGGRPRRRAL